MFIKTKLFLKNFTTINYNSNLKYSISILFFIILCSNSDMFTSRKYPAAKNQNKQVLEMKGNKEQNTVFFLKNFFPHFNSSLKVKEQSVAGREVSSFDLD